MNSAIDFDHLEKYVSGDVALRDEILDIFTGQVHSLLQKFDVFQSDESWNDTAHTLKGAARGVGAWDLGQLCEDAEKLVGPTPGKPESRASLLVSLRITAHSVVEAAHRRRLAEVS